jgi:hypothetical protein
MEIACRQAATRVLDMLKLHAGHTCDSEVQVHSGR